MLPYAQPHTHLPHAHSQRLLYSLAAIFILMLLWFWLVYTPIQRRWCMRSCCGAHVRADNGLTNTTDVETDVAPVVGSYAVVSS